MVVVRQRTQAGDGPATTVTRTLDVRLRRANAVWAVHHLASAGGSPVGPPERLARAARAVLRNPRIWLPDTARWDINRGGVDEPLLEAMAAAAKRAPYAVAVIDSGHPRNVFATSRPSAHSARSAVDIYEVDGCLVVRQRGEGTPAYSFARALYGAGAYQLGSPWVFAGAAEARSPMRSIRITSTCRRRRPRARPRTADRSAYGRRLRGSGRPGVLRRGARSIVETCAAVGAGPRRLTIDRRDERSRVRLSTNER
jgi:hypothetical protein